MAPFHPYNDSEEWALLVPFRRKLRRGCTPSSQLRGHRRLPHLGVQGFSWLSPPPTGVGHLGLPLFPRPRDLRLASHLLLRDALKMDESVFSQSSQGLLGPHQASVLLAKAQ